MLACGSDPNDFRYESKIDFYSSIFLDIRTAPAVKKDTANIRNRDGNP